MSGASPEKTKTVHQRNGTSTFQRHTVEGKYDANKKEVKLKISQEYKLVFVVVL